MAGLYPDVPAPRMAWHRDGSIAGYFHSGSGITVLTQGQMEGENSESYAGINIAVNGQLRYMAIIFPELRDLAAYFTVCTFASLGGGASQTLETSADTTNGQDGTWTQRAANFAYSGTYVYRTGITTLAVTGIKGIRFRIAAGDGGTDTGIFHVIHLYGTPNAAATRYLAVTDTGGTEVGGAYFDFGDDPRGGAAEIKQFKVKNLNGSLTANTVTVGRQALTEKSPIFLDDYEFSDGGAYASSLSLGNLAPGASSGTLSVRRTTPLAANIGLEAGLITVTAASWS